MTWHTIERDGAKLRGFDGGRGSPIVFQHGLGGDEAQIAEVFPLSGWRRLTLECRAQGKSEAGDSAQFSIATFADDVLAFADARGLGRFAIGGISMGAAIASRLAVKHPQRIAALILARPAWLWDAAPANMQVITEAAKFISDGRRQEFLDSDTAVMLKAQAPDNLATLVRYFDWPNPQGVAKLISTIAADGPRIREPDVRAIKVPTLVLGTEIDWIHPLSHATTLASMIPNATFLELTPKAVDKARHAEEFKAAVAKFLKQAGL